MTGSSHRKRDIGIRLVAAFLVAITFILVCQGAVPYADTGPQTGKRAKYVFLFIGDGMGIVQRTAAENYKGSISGDSFRPAPTRLVMKGFPAQGFCTTYSADFYITDSAAAATALATGYKTRNGMLGVDPSGTIPIESMASMAKRKGMRVGIVSSVFLNDGTPAGFYAHQRDRKKFNEIVEDLCQSGFDYFAGGGLAETPNSGVTAEDLMIRAQNAGYKVVRDKGSFESFKADGGKVLAVNPTHDAKKAMPFDMDRTTADISLAEFTRKGIELLENPAGFFLMVEGGKIDWACHANDALAAILDVCALDAAVGEALEFLKRHPDETLVVVTADHETGGMSLGVAASKQETFLARLKRQKMSSEKFKEIVAEYKKSHDPGSAAIEDLASEIKNAFGLILMSKEQKAELETKVAEGGTAGAEASEQLAMALSEQELDQLRAALSATMAMPHDRSKLSRLLIYGDNEPVSITLTRILNLKAGIGWASTYHTGVPVPVSAIGVESNTLNGYYDNTDLARKIMAIMGMAPAVLPARVARRSLGSFDSRYGLVMQSAR